MSHNFVNSLSRHTRYCTIHTPLGRGPPLLPNIFLLNLSLSAILLVISRSAFIMSGTTYHEMAQTHCWNDTKGTPYQQLCSRDDLIATLLAAAASDRYTPSAPSPLNPKSNGEIRPKKNTARPRRLRPARKKPVETPTEKLLRRKAAIAYERSTKSSPPRKDHSTLLVAQIGELSEKTPSVTIATNEASAVDSKGTGPLMVGVWKHRHDLANDVEVQSAAQLSVWRQRQACRQRLEILLMLILLSACLTLLTVVGLDSLRGQYVFG